MISDVKSIQHLIRAKFPCPTRAWGERTKWLESASEAEKTEEYYLSLAHMAVNSNDKDYREIMGSHMIGRLTAGEELPIAARAWLIYVLSNLNDFPHEGRGAPAKGRQFLERQTDLARFMAEHREQHPKCKVTERLQAAASHMNLSYETVRSIYYSNGYKQIVKSLY